MFATSKFFYGKLPIKFKRRHSRLYDLTHVKKKKAEFSKFYIV